MRDEMRKREGVMKPRGIEGERDKKEREGWREI